ncbi:MAG: hypothetical protein LBB67_02200 [Oscillospiraceae bacterium]|nr:hypothetical protein [Oscillospiraceae bacterium]
MLTVEQISTLKQVNISVDADKTKARVEQLWKSQRNVTKNEFLAFTNCSVATVHRVYKTGSLHIRLAIAFGQMLNINPYYLTGETDEPSEFDEAQLVQILEQHGYKKLAAELDTASFTEKPKRKYTRRQKPVEEELVAEKEVDPEPEVEPETAPAAEEPVEVEAPVEVEEAVAAEAPVAAEEPPAADIDLSEEDIQALLHSLLILKRAGVAAAEEKLAKIKGIFAS